MKRQKPELLIPASSLEVLKTAVIFGADAVYIGGEAFGLRAKAKNFTSEEMAEGIVFAHKYGVKVYVTANILAHNGVCDQIGDLIDRNIATAQEKLYLVEAQAGEWRTLEQLCAAVMIRLGMDLNAPAKVIGGKRNIQVLVEYLVETERLAFRVREG